MLLLTVLSVIGLSAAADNAVQSYTIGNNKFTADLYKVVKGSNDGNFMICPFSAETILSLTEAGAKGETQKQMRTTLRLPDNENEIEAGIGSIISSLNKDTFTFNLANKLYIQEHFTVNSSFQEVATKVYQSEVQNIDFGNAEAAVSNINSWVEEKTHNTINDLLSTDDISPDTKLVLINALYFKANWTHTFKSPVSKPFHTTADNSVEVSMMTVTASFNYASSSQLNAQFLELAFEGGNASMIVVLPKDIKGISSLEEKIEDVLNPPDLQLKSVEVSFPKYLIDSKFDLTSTLQTMGMEDAFDNNADLSGIAGKQGELSIGKVIQKTHIAVNSSGVEASAATAVTIGRNLPRPPDAPDVEFNVDHPFIFYIKIDALIVFLGRVTEPKD